MLVASTRFDEHLTSVIFEVIWSAILSEEYKNSVCISWGFIRCVQFFVICACYSQFKYFKSLESHSTLISARRILSPQSVYFEMERALILILFHFFDRKSEWNNFWKQYLRTIAEGHLLHWICRYLQPEPSTNHVNPSSRVFLQWSVTKLNPRIQSLYFNLKRNLHIQIHLPDKQRFSVTLIPFFSINQ